MRLLLSILGVLTLLSIVPLGKTNAFHSRGMKTEVEEMQGMYVRNLRHGAKEARQLEEGGEGRGGTSSAIVLGSQNAASQRHRLVLRVALKSAGTHLVLLNLRGNYIKWE